jgi:hypothetical protein
MAQLGLAALSARGAARGARRLVSGLLWRESLLSGRLLSSG